MVCNVEFATLSQMNRLDTLAQNGRKLAKEHFSLEREMEKLGGIVKELVFHLTQQARRLKFRLVILGSVLCLLILKF